MRAILCRDIRLAMRSGGSWLLGLVFFILFLSLCGIAFGGKMATLTPLGISLSWLAFIFSALLSAPDIFRSDLADGSLEQFKLSRIGLTKYVIARILSLSFLSFLPLILIIPLIGQFFGLGQSALIGLGLSLIAALPAIAVYTALSGALLCGRQNSGFFSIILAAPLLIPILIFGISAAENIANIGIAAPELRILLGLSLIGFGIGLPAIIAALLANLE